MNFKLLKTQLKSGGNQYFSIYAVYILSKMIFEAWNIKILEGIGDIYLILIPLLMAVNILSYYREIIARESVLLKIIPVSRKVVYRNYLLGNLFIILGFNSLLFLAVVFLDRALPYSNDYLMLIRRGESLGNFFIVLILSLNTFALSSFLVGLIVYLETKYKKVRGNKLIRFLKDTRISILLIVLGLTISLRIIGAMTGVNPIIYSFKSGGIVRLRDFRPEKQALLLGNYIRQFGGGIYINLRAVGINTIFLILVAGWNAFVKRSWDSN